MDTFAPYELRRLVKLATSDICDPIESFELSKALIKTSQHWTEKDGASIQNYKEILVAIASLSSEVLASSQSSVSKETAASISSASKLILTFMIDNLNHENVKKFSLPLTALCTGSPSLNLKEKTKIIEVIQDTPCFPQGFVLDRSISERPPKPPLPMAMQMQVNILKSFFNQNIFYMLTNADLYSIS